MQDYKTPKPAETILPDPEEDILSRAIKENIKEISGADLENELAGRIRLENRIRKIKRAGKECPFYSKGICNCIVFRCGERQQFSTPEEEKDTKTAYRCNYKPVLALNDFYVLIVDDDEVIRELCMEFFQNLGIKNEQIDAVTNVEEAQAKLIQGKIQNRQYSIVLSDIKMSRSTGYELVNYLVERNHNSRILLMSGYVDDKDFPKYYLGDKEIIPGHKVVSHFFNKPVAFPDFETIVRKIAEEFQAAG